MEVENNLLAVANVMFRNRANWKYVTDKQKIDYFFIINRFLSKKYPNESQLLNYKSVNSDFDKIHHISAMDTWFIFMQDKPYPKWFWSKSKNDKAKPIISADEIRFLVTEYDLREEDIDILNRYYPEIVGEEISYYKEIQKMNKKNG